MVRCSRGCCRKEIEQFSANKVVVGILKTRRLAAEMLTERNQTMLPYLKRQQLYLTV